MHNGRMFLPAFDTLRRLLIIFMLAAWFAVLGVVPMPALAQSDDTPEPAALLESARKDMDTVRARQAKEEAMDDASVQQLRKLALSAKVRSEEAAAAMAPELTAVQARLAELGPPAEGGTESPDVAAQRAQLQRSASTLDSQIKLARLLAVEAEQAAATASAHRRSQFSARLEARTPTVLGAQFWKEVAGDVPADLRRVKALMADVDQGLAAVPASMWLISAAVVALLVLARVGAQRLLLRFNATRVPSGRLRRSLHAVGILLIKMTTPGLILHVLLVALASGGAVSAPLGQLLAGVEAFVWFGSFVVGLGAALLMPDKPSWRLTPLTDDTALRLRWFPLVLARLASATDSSRVDVPPSTMAMASTSGNQR
ncbi:MAG: DUF3772 domain-containing protein, partial [Rubrivivax sp.]